MSRDRRGGPPHEPTPTPLTLLKLNESAGDTTTDYLFCPICRVHVPCRRVASGGWEVDCPGCHGECAFCDCYLKRFCFGSRELFPPFARPDEVTR